MEIAPERAHAIRHHDGSDIYLCSPGCARAFDAEPEQYITAPQDVTKSAMPPRAEADVEYVPSATNLQGVKDAVETAGLYRVTEASIVTEADGEGTDVVPAEDFTEDTILRLAAAVERSSEHPLATAIVSGAEARGLRVPEVASFAAVPGHGVEADVEGKHLLLGNAKLMKDRTIALGRLEAEAQYLADAGKTPMAATR